MRLGGIRYSSVEVQVNQLRPEHQHAGNSANRQEIRSAWLPDCRVPACARLAVPLDCMTPSATISAVAKFGEML
jgi:hypothetical protein